MVRVEVRIWLEEVQESKRSRKAERFLGLLAKGLACKVCLKFGKMAKKLNDLLRKSIIIYAITNEFASRSAVRNDTVGKNLIARAYSSVGRAKAF